MCTEAVLHLADAVLERYGPQLWLNLIIKSSSFDMAIHLLPLLYAAISDIGAAFLPGRSTNVTGFDSGFNGPVPLILKP